MTIITLKLRSVKPPHDTWTDEGFEPFEVFGEQFAVTRIPCALDDCKQFRATHLATGAAVPRTDCEIISQVEPKAREVLDGVGEEKFRQGVLKVEHMIRAYERQEDES